MSILVNLALGLLFGLGLVVSGMADPAKVLAFLDPFGTWDPSLAFVMSGAVLVAFFGYRIVLRRERPLAAPRFRLPSRRDVDARLLAGPAVFGVGWGLSGFCPGPALAALGLAQAGALAFVSAMFAGMWAARLVAETGPPLASSGPPRAPRSSP